MYTAVPLSLANGNCKLQIVTVCVRALLMLEMGRRCVSLVASEDRGEEGRKKSALGEMR